MQRTGQDRVPCGTRLCRCRRCMCSRSSVTSTTPASKRFARFRGWASFAAGAAALERFMPGQRGNARLSRACFFCR